MSTDTTAAGPNESVQDTLISVNGGPAAAESDDRPTSQRMMDSFSDEMRVTVQTAVEALPKMRPHKVLGAASRLQQSALAVEISEVWDLLDRLEGSSDGMTSAILATYGQLVELMEQTLRMTAVSGEAYDKWSASIPLDSAVQTIIYVFWIQHELREK